MSNPAGPFQFRIVVAADNADEESRLVKAIASEFIRLGIPSVSVIADGEHNNYVNGEVYNVTDIMGGLFRAAPDETTGAFVSAHSSTSFN